MNRQKKQKRNRGLILTRQGWQKLQNAKLEQEFKEKNSSRFTIEELSDRAGITPVTFRKVMSREVGVDKQTLMRLFTAFGLELDKIDYTKPSPDLVTQEGLKTPERIDWGEAVCVSMFYGRTEELNTLVQWLMKDRCRVVALLGMGGIGKTCLAVKLAEEVQRCFEYVIWRSLYNAPPVFELLANLIQFVSNEQVLETELPKNLEGRILHLIHYLQQHRCLIILDNVETIMQGGVYAGFYREGYEGYGQLIKQVGEIAHESTLLLTSREKPRDLASLEGQALPVRSFYVSGLEATAGHKIFELKGLYGSESELTTVVARYTGNALALKIAATMIKDVFDGNISEFLKQDTTVFGDISHLLDQQFSRLSNLEKDIIYWLAINREPVSLSELREDIVSRIPVQKLLEALESLAWRCLIDKATPTLIQKSTAFTLQPVVMEYATQRMIEQVCEEIKTENIDIFRCHALMKATAKDYVRETQIRLIIKPVINELLTVFRNKKGIENKLKQMLAKLQETSPQEQSYTAGNILNLFCHLETELSGYDFSSLCVWQADLRNVKLHNVNFAHADLAKCVFAETLGGIFSVAFSKNGELLATGDTNGDIRLWEAANRRQLLVCKGHTGWVCAVTFSPDGKVIASASKDQTVKLWDTSNGQCLSSLQDHIGEIWSVAFSADGHMLASAGEDETVKLWNVHTSQCIQTLRIRGGRVWSVAFSPDSHILASSSDDHMIRLWNAKNFECFRTLKGHTHLVWSVAFSADGQILASASHDRTVKLWDISTGSCVQTLQGHTDWVHSVAFHPNSCMVASSSEDKTIKLWDISTGKCLKTLDSEGQGVWSVAFSPDGQTLVSGYDDQVMRLWDVNNGHCLQTWRGNMNGVWFITFSSNGQILASAHGDQAVNLWDVSTGECLRTLTGHRGIVTSVTFNPDGQILASASADQTVKVWDVHTGQCIKTLRGHTSRVTCVAFSPRENLLASGSYDSLINLWDIKTGRCLQTLQAHTHRIWSVAFSPNGQILASGSHDKTVKLWDVSSGKYLQSLEGHTNWIWSVTFSPNGRMLASGSGDHSIKLWDISIGRCIATLPGLKDSIYSTAFSHNGNMLASAHGNSVVKLWDINTGQCLRTLEGHNKWVWSVVFSPNGKILASSSEDATIKLWDVETGDCIKTIQTPNLYERMKITGIKSLTEAQKNTLKTLGAFECRDQ